MENIFDNITMDRDKPVHQEIADLLSRLIFENKLKPGDRLVEKTLADHLGVSRTPVREALRQLDSEGLVVSTPRKGAIVSEISREVALEMYDIRELLEGFAARLACNNLPLKKINYLQELVHDMDQCIQKGETQKLYELNKLWNETIMEYSESVTLQKYMKTIYDHLGRLRPITMKNKASREEILSEYLQILEALKSGDIDGAELATRQHVRGAKKRYILDSDQRQTR